MKNFALLLGSALLAAASARADQLVVNGGFEMNVIDSDYRAFMPGQTGITGWTVLGKPNQGVDIVRSGYYSPLIHSGNQAIDLTGSPGPGGIEQILSTKAGKTYRISFFVGSNVGPYLDGLTFSWDGIEVATLSSPAMGSLTRFDYFLKAESSSTALRFMSNVPGFCGPSIDDVSVTSVPEPAAYAALGTAFALVARFRRRQQRTNA